jgi:hypothetical protein
VLSFLPFFPELLTNNEGKWYGNVLVKFPKIRKLLNFRTSQSKIPEISGGKSNETGLPGKKFSNIWVYTEDSGKCCSIGHWIISENSNRSFSSSGKDNI